jgi:LPXTG-motif cell wall-anchored protein
VLKRFVTALALITASLIASTPALAALTSPLPDGESLWVMNIVNGNFKSLDPETGTLATTFSSATVTSNSWIVGADYDPDTDSIYWIKDFGDPNQALVRYNVGSNVETVFETGGYEYDIRGIDVSDGVIRVSGTSADATFIAKVTLSGGSLTVALSEISVLSAVADSSAIAIDPTDGQLYVLTYDCKLYEANGTAATLLTNLGDIDNLNTDCVGLDFDSSGRAWMTYNSTGNTASFIPSNIAGTAERSEWDSFNSETEYGEALFVKEASNLAETGFNATGLIGAGAMMITLGAVVVARRRKA